MNQAGGTHSQDRLFVALEIPEEVKAGLSGLQSCFPGLKWTAAANLHLTLRFIGLVPRARLEPIQQALRRVQSGSFRLTVAGLGLFTRRTGGILWAGVHEEPSLMELKARVDEALCLPAGPKEETFSPHLTLSRLKSSVSPALKKQVQAKTAQRFGEFQVTGFTLFRSLLRPSGAIHEAVERFPLSKD
jgi:2'-5' RNA ligase